MVLKGLIKVSNYTAVLYHTMTVLLEYVDNLLQFSTNVNIPIKIYFTLFYYVGIMFYGFGDLLCWHNRWVPSLHATQQ